MLPVHLASLAAGAVYILAIDRHLWFFGDDWDFLVRRGLHHPAASIWQPHNEHWSTLPILLYRALFTVFALRTYVPYLLPVVLAHLVLAHLLWRLCVRSHVDPWVATATVAVFVVLGSGAENLMWAFQIGFVGSLAFGAAALVVVVGRPHDRGVPAGSAARPLVVGLLLTASLMCSTVGDSMVVAVGVAVGLASGWRGVRAALWLPVASYVVWYGLVGRNAVRGDHITLTTVVGIPSYLWSILAGSLGDAVGLAAAGPAILLLVVVWTAGHATTLREEPTVSGLAVAVVSFLSLAALGRQRYGDVPPSRYVYIVIALLLPLLSFIIALSVGRPGRWVVLAVVGVVGVANISAFGVFAKARDISIDVEHRQVVTDASLFSGGVGSLRLTPIDNENDLTVPRLVRLVRLRLIPDVEVGRSVRLGTLAALDVVLSSRTSAYGSLHLAGTAGVRSVGGSSHCRTLSPLRVGSQVVLVGRRSRVAVSIQGPPRGDYTVFVGRPAGAGAVMAMPASGRATLEEDVGTQEITLSLPTAGPTTVCGLRR